MNLSPARRTATVVATGALALVVAGCGGGDSDGTSPLPTPSTATPSSSSDASPTPTGPGAPGGATPSGGAGSGGSAGSGGAGSGAGGTEVAVGPLVDEVLAAMKRQSSVRMSIAGNPDLTYRADFRYGRTPAARVVTAVAGEPVTMVLVGDTLYVKEGSAKYVALERGDARFDGLVGAASALDPIDSVTSLRGAIAKVVRVGAENVGGERLTRYDATVELSKVDGALAGLAGTGTSGTTVVSVYTDAQGLLRQLSSAIGGQSVAIRYDGWGKAVAIKAPAASEITGG